MKQEEGDIIEGMANFCRIADKKALIRYEIIRQVLETEFHQYEFDVLRREIGRCYVVSAYQGCITLTNHLLERYCKILLICYESGFKTVSDLKSLESTFEKANQKYMNADLNTVLNACRKLNLITKEERKEFDKYRKVFRNGYSHASAEKILGNAKGKFMLGKLDGSEESEFQELTFSKIPFLQGIAIENFSQVNAFPYFVDVENLIRKTINHIQPDEHKLQYPLIRIVVDEQMEGNKQ